MQGVVQKQHRVVRGGAFNNNERALRCAYRNNRNPNNRNDNQGFRVVLSTFFVADARIAMWGNLHRRGEKWRNRFLAAPRCASADQRGRAHSNGPTPWARSLA